MFPALLEDYVAEDNPVRAVDVFVDGLDLDKLGFVGVQPLWDIVSDDHAPAWIDVGGGQAYVIDGQGRLIAHRDLSLVLRSPVQGSTHFTGLAQVRAARAAVAGATADRVEIARDISGREVLTAYARVKRLGWLVFVERPTDEAYAPFIGK